MKRPQPSLSILFINSIDQVYIIEIIDLTYQKILCIYLSGYEHIPINQTLKRILKMIERKQLRLTETVTGSG